MKTTIYFKLTFITQKHGYQTGLDTLVVHAVTDDCLKLIFFIFYSNKIIIKLNFFANALNNPPGDYDRKIKTQRNWLRFVQAVEHVV